MNILTYFNDMLHIFNNCCSYYCAMSSRRSFYRMLKRSNEQTDARLNAVEWDAHVHMHMHSQQTSEPPLIQSLSEDTMFMDVDTHETSRIQDGRLNIFPTTDS